MSEAERLELGRFLREARGDRSIREVATRLAGPDVDKADVNRRRVREYESGAVLPTVTTAWRLAEIYEISAFRLLHKAGHIVELLRPIAWLFDGSDVIGERLLREAAVVFALYAFPRRGDSLSLAGALSEAKLDKAFLHVTQLGRPRGKLPHTLGLAKSALGDSSLPIDSRRAIAAEYVHAYVRSIDPLLYAAAAKNIYHLENDQ